MGRSVSIPSGAQVVAFAHLDNEEWDWDDWSSWKEEMRSEIRSIAPSMRNAEGWVGNEDQILASNALANFGFSEYCGLVSIWLLPENDGLAKHWCNQIEAKFMAEFSELKLIGRASNGEAFFERVA